MPVRWSVILALLCPAVLLGVVAASPASGDEAPFGPDAGPVPGGEDGGLPFKEIPSVISASLFEEKLPIAPSSVSVVSGDDLRRTGARDIPDALRWLPGIDAISYNAYHTTVSARGHANRSGVKMLALHDGVILYTPFTGNSYWEFFPGFIENIERVEGGKGDIAIGGQYLLDEQTRLSAQFERDRSFYVSVTRRF